MVRPKKWFNNARDFVSHRTDSRTLKPGDHIYGYRRFGTYSHHGIFVGSNFVIHFVSTKKGKVKRHCEKCPPSQSDVPLGVVKTCLDCFLREGNRTEEDVMTTEDCQRSVHEEHAVRLYYYGVSSFQYKFSYPGTCSTKKCRPDEEVVTTAEDFLKNGFGEYNLETNNCEHFATLCKTGEGCSAQTETKRAKLFRRVIPQS